MANFDLISEDDFFSGMKKEEKPEKPPKPEPDEDLFAQPLSGEEAPVLPEEPENSDENPADLLTQDFSEDLKESFDFNKPDQGIADEGLSPEGETTPEQDIPAAQDVTPEPEPEPEPEPTTADEEIPDYYDDKQGGINYKPILKGVGIAVAIVALFFVVKLYFFGGPAEPEKAQTNKPAVATPKQKGPSPEEIRRNKLYTTVAAETKFKASKVAGITSVAAGQAKLSSVLLYGKELMFEVFAKNRDALAKLNVKLKNTFKDNKISVVATESRPGLHGGILGVYKLTLQPAAGAGGGTLSAPFKSVEDAQGWLKYMADNGSLKIKSMKSRALQREGGSDVYELDAILSGTRASFGQLLKAFGTADKNFTIHKLTINAVDQKNFNKKKYEARLILKIFI